MVTPEERWAEFYERVAAKARSLADPATGLLDERHARAVPCPGCGSGNGTPRARRHGFCYVECRGCGLVYVNPMPRDDVIEAACNDAELREFYTTHILFAFQEAQQVPEFRKRARTLAALLERPRARLLDVGSAAGNFLRTARDEGFEVEGLELNRAHVAVAREERGLGVHCRTLEQMGYPGGRFDAVTLWDVLEHLPRPLETLREAHRLLAPGGVLGLATVNHRCINERLLKDRWRYYFPPDHLVSFTPRVLGALLRGAGFEVLRTEHQYVFEVLADEWLGPAWTRPPAARGDLGARLRFLVYVTLARLTEPVLGALDSGDLLTVYARKRGG